VRRLSALDAQFLNVESRTTTGHVGAVVLLDPADTASGELTLDDVRDVLEPRLHLAAPFRERLVEVPLGLGYPYWADDPEFDLEYHLREVALPQPGTDAELGEQVARIHSRPLDRSRPLWEMYLVHGLADGRVALYAKIHHAAIDGVSGAEILAAIMDTTPEPRDVDPGGWEPDRVPSAWELLPRALASVADRSLDMVTGLPRSLPHLTAVPGVQRLPGIRAVGDAVTVVRAIVGFPSGQRTSRDLVAPRTPFNGPITAHRRVAFASLPLDEVKQVKDAFDMTVNDVVLALTTGVLRRWLLDRDALPTSPLVAAVPVSVRDDRSESGGNLMSVMVVALPTNLPDPAARLGAVHQEVTAAKAEFDAVPATLLQDLATLMPTALSGLAARALFRVMTAPGALFNLFVSNVQGPQLPLYIAGAKVDAVYPVSAVSDVSGGLNLTLFSYDGALDVGLIACREMVPDLWVLAAYLRDELDAMLDLV
jgi:WS/DGAT/MGAT family acyltransferase